MVVNILQEDRVAATVGKIRRSFMPLDHDHVLEVFSRNELTYFVELRHADLRRVDAAGGPEPPRHEHRHGAAASADVGDGHAGLEFQDRSELRDISLGVSEFELKNRGWTLGGRRRRDDEQ
jgi:hypothetical protein